MVALARESRWRGRSRIFSFRWREMNNSAMTVVYWHASHSGSSIAHDDGDAPLPECPTPFPFIPPFAAPFPFSPLADISPVPSAPFDKPPPDGTALCAPAREVYFSVLVAPSERR